MKGAGSKFGHGLNSRHFAIKKGIYLKLSSNTKRGRSQLAGTLREKCHV